MLNKSLRLNITLPIYAFVLTLAFAGFFSMLEVDTFHDGILLKPALDVAKGKILFKDTFTQYGALTTFIQTLGIKIFGPYLISLRLTAALFYAASAVALWKIWLRFLSLFATGVTFLIWLLLSPYYILLFHPWSSIYALFFQSLSLIFLLRFFDTQKKSFLIAAGVGAALTFWCRQPVGVLLFAAIIFFWVFLALIRRQSRKYVLLYSLLTLFGFILGSLPFFFYLIRYNAILDWWKQSIVLAFIFGQVKGGSFSILEIFKSLFLVKPNGPTLLWLLWPLSCVYMAIKAIFKLISDQVDQRNPIKILAVSFVCFASWLQYYPITDYAHVYWAASPMIGLSIYALKPFYKTKLKTIILLTVVLLVYHSKFIARIDTAWYKIHKRKYYRIEQPNALRFMNLVSSQAVFHTKVVDIVSKYLDDHPDKTYVNLHSHAFYSLIHPNYFRPYIYHNSVIYPDYRENAVDYIEVSKPLVIEHYEISDFLYNYQLIYIDEANDFSILIPTD